MQNPIPRLFRFSLITLLFCSSSCSKGQLTAVLDDIARDTYTQNAKKERMENLGNPSYAPPESYDQYQRDRKAYNSRQPVE